MTQTSRMLQATTSTAGETGMPVDLGASLLEPNAAPDDIAEAQLISTDVFDTLLIRTLRSERTRIVLGERRFAALLARRGVTIAPDMLVEARLQAQRMAFSALNAAGGAGEARLTDIIARQLTALGLPRDLTAPRLAIELEIEKASLKPNTDFADVLRAYRANGRRVVAISDTTLPGDSVAELIAHFHGRALIDRVYSSADLGATKRKGDLFALAARAEGFERILHFGDDAHADVRAPQEQGFAASHMPRPALLNRLRRLDGARTELARGARRRRRIETAPQPDVRDAYEFGHRLLGPIVTQFCTRIWMYAAQAEAGPPAALLFCARGGIGIRTAFERVLTKLDLPLTIRRENLMVSRLVAARAALLARHDAALEELEREFHTMTMADVAKALGGGAYELTDAWHEGFSGERFLSLLFGPGGQDPLRDIQIQNERFARHLSVLASGAQRLILCDTGLYGSTQRLLAAGLPALQLETIQFARCNYKGHSEEHFARVAGLMVERNCYSPFDEASCVLRYWHLIESLFEPCLPSVRAFSEDDEGRVHGNCGDITFGAVDPAAGNVLLSGVLAYIDALPAERAGLIASRDAEHAWSRLKQTLVRPTAADVQRLELNERSVDFGRDGTVRTINSAANGTLTTKLRGLTSQLWREGAIVREFPLLAGSMLTLLEALHSARWVRSRR